VNCLISNELHIIREAFGHEDLTNAEIEEYIDVSGEELKRHICSDVCPFRDVCKIAKDLKNGIDNTSRRAENPEN